jgi:hypothetical protein
LLRTSAYPLTPDDLTTNVNAEVDQPRVRISLPLDRGLRRRRRRHDHDRPAGAPRRSDALEGDIYRLQDRDLGRVRTDE